MIRLEIAIWILKDHMKSENIFDLQYKDTYRIPIESRQATLGHDVLALVDSWDRKYFHSDFRDQLFTFKITEHHKHELETWNFRVLWNPWKNENCQNTSSRDYRRHSKVISSSLVSETVNWRNGLDSNTDWWLSRQVVTETISDDDRTHTLQLKPDNI